MISTSSPIQIYDARVGRGELKMDPVQQAAVQKLDVLQHQLIAQSVPRKWYRNWFVRSRQVIHKGFYLCGGVGTGKTLLMDIFYQSLPAEFGHRIHFHRFMQSIHDEKNKVKDQPDPLGIVAQRWASQWNVLCLDEFSVTDITDAMIMSGLLRHLFDYGMVLITTSNTRPENLYRGGLQRERFLPAIALLENHTVCIEVDSGSDYRMEHLRNEAIFHIHNGDETILKLRHCFSTLR